MRTTFVFWKKSFFWNEGWIFRILWGKKKGGALTNEQEARVADLFAWYFPESSKPEETGVNFGFGKFTRLLGKIITVAGKNRPFFWDMLRSTKADDLFEKIFEEWPFKEKVPLRSPQVIIINTETAGGQHDAYTIGLQRRFVDSDDDFKMELQPLGGDPYAVITKYFQIGKGQKKYER
jgi:hypothetical protein